MTWMRHWWVSLSLRVLEELVATKSVTGYSSMILTSCQHWVTKRDLNLLKAAKTISETAGKWTKTTRTWDTNLTHRQQSQMQLDITQECTFWQAVMGDRVKLHQTTFHLPNPRPRTTSSNHKLSRKALTKNHLIRALARSRSSRWWTGRASLSGHSNAKRRIQQRC